MNLSKQLMLLSLWITSVVFNFQVEAQVIEPRIAEYIDIVTTTLTIPEESSRFGSSIITGDFNGDGIADTVFGSPFKDNSNLLDTGMITVKYGGSLPYSGINIYPSVMENSKSGSTLSQGDFNNDGYDDLVVGVPEGALVFTEEGFVVVYYGSEFGINSTNGQILENNGGQGEGSQFGFAMTTGDYDDDGYDDLVVSAPYFDIGTEVDAGIVFIYYGGQISTGNMGLSPSFRDIISQNSSGITESNSESGDLFGYSLATGQLDGYAIQVGEPRYDDLVVGVPHEDWFNTIDAGALHVFYGGSTGISGVISENNKMWIEGDLNGGFTSEFSEFGSALATGNLNGDVSDDLLVSAIGADVLVSGVTITGAGEVFLLPGKRSVGLDETLSQGFNLNSVFIPGGISAYDSFGSHLAAGDLNKDGYAEAIIGSDLKNYGDANNGMVHIISGAATGLNTTDVAGFVAGGRRDYLGQALAIKKDRRGTSLLVGIPNIDYSIADNVGMVIDIVDANYDDIFKDGF